MINIYIYIYTAQNQATNLALVFTEKKTMIHKKSDTCLAGSAVDNYST